MSNYLFLQNLLNSSNSVIIPPGEYTTEHTLVIDRENVTVQGAGCTITKLGGGTLLRCGNPNNGTGDILLRDLLTEGGGIEFIRCSRSGLERVHVYLADVGVRLTDCYQFHYDNGDVRGVNTAGIVIDGGGGNDQYLRNVRVVGIAENQANHPTGLLVKCSQGLWMDNVGTVDCHDGIVFSPESHQVVEYVFMRGCGPDTGTGEGWLLDGTRGRVRGITSTGDWSGTNSRSGLTAKHVNDLKLTTMRVLNNKAHGLHLVGCKEVVIDSCTVSGNGTLSTSGSYHGITTEKCDRVTLSKNRSGQIDNYANSQGYGHFDNGSTRLLLRDNDFSNNLLG